MKKKRITILDSIRAEDPEKRKRGRPRKIHAILPIDYDSEEIENNLTNISKNKKFKIKRDGFTYYVYLKDKLLTHTEDFNGIDWLLSHFKEKYGKEVFMHKEKTMYKIEG